MPKNLTGAQTRQVRKIIDRAKKDDGIPRTAQQTIPFQRMFSDGICRVTDNYYTKTIQYQDINYQLAQQEDKTAIFEEWCSFLNFFDSSIHFELSFMNMATDAESFEKKIRIPYRSDHFNTVRSEYSQMLKTQLAQGNNGLTKTKYITFGIEAESMREAKPRLDHVQMNLMNNFKRLGVLARVLNGRERLQLMHAMFHMADNDRFYFDWNWLPGSGLSVKDFIAPSSFSFPGRKTFTMGNLHGAMSYLQITASDLSDQVLKDFLDMESSEIVTIHIQSVDQTSAIKQIKHTITELDRSKIEEQKKAVRSGYDIGHDSYQLASYLTVLFEDYTREEVQATLQTLFDIIPPSEAKPGDLIFFQGTYDIQGASHVGIYVGNNMMIHCGHPVQYTNITKPYWVEHFYCFGRLPD